MTRRKRIEGKLDNWLSVITTDPRATKHRGAAKLAVIRLKKLNDFSMRQSIRNRILRSRATPTRFQLWLIGLGLPLWEEIFSMAELT